MPFNESLLVEEKKGFDESLLEEPPESQEELGPPAPPPEPIVPPITKKTIDFSAGPGIYGVPMGAWDQPLVPPIPPKWIESGIRTAMKVPLPTWPQFLRLIPEQHREEVIKGISESASRQASSLTSPEGLGIAAGTMLAPEVGIPALVGMGEAQLPKALENLQTSQTPEETAGAITDLVGIGSMILGPVVPAGRKPPPVRSERVQAVAKAAEIAPETAREAAKTIEAEPAAPAAELEMAVTKPDFIADNSEPFGSDRWRMKNGVGPDDKLIQIEDGGWVSESPPTNVKGQWAKFVRTVNAKGEGKVIPVNVEAPKKGVIYAPEEGKVKTGVQPERVGTDAQRVSAEAGPSDSLQPAAPVGTEAAAPPGQAPREVLLKPDFASKYDPETLMQRPAWVQPGSKLDKVLGDLREKNDPLIGINIAPIWKALTTEQRQDLSVRGWIVTDSRDPKAVILKLSQDVPAARKYYGIQAKQALKATPSAAGPQREVRSEPESASTASPVASTTGGVAAPPAAVGQPTVTPTVAKGQARVFRGVSAQSRFNRETEAVGEDLLSWVSDNMRILSKTQALKQWGKQKFKQTGEYDDAPKMSAPHHNVVYDPNGSGPDAVAQAAYEAGKLSSPSVVEFWKTLGADSERRIKASKRMKTEARWLDEEAKQTEDWEKDTSKGQVKVTSDDLNVGDKIQVGDQMLDVTGVDADTGEVTVKDGPKYGIQKLPSGKNIYVESFTPEKAAPAESLFPEEEMPFNLAGEKGTLPPAKPPESVTGYGTERLAQQEMFAIQKIVESKDPAKSADAAQTMYGGARAAISKLEEQLRVIDTYPPKERKAIFGDVQRARLKEVLNLLRQRATMPEGPGAGLEAAIIPGAKQFVEQDIIPAGKSVAQAVGETWRQFRNLISPVSAGPKAELAAGVIREHRAVLAQKDLQAREQFAKAKREMDRLSPRASLKFIDDIETGRAQPTPELQSLSSELRNAFDKRVADVRALGTGKLEHLITDYFPHIWKDSDAAVSWYARILGRRPLRGPASFLKHRTIPTTADGVAARLEPVTWNPIELSLLKFHEMDRYVMGQKIFQELKDKGLAEFSRSDIAPEGMAKINDRIANVVEYRPTVKADGTPGAPERILRGHWYVQEDAARVLNNFLSPGLERYKWFRAIRWMGNTMNMAQLGFSGYHAMFTMIDSGTSKLSLGIEQLAQGRGKGALTSVRGLAGTPMAANQLEYYLKGSKVLHEYTKPGSVGGDYAKVVDALLAAGGRTEMPRIFKNSSLENFFTAIRNGNYPGAILRTPFATIEAVSYPLMQNIVPRLKLGAFSEMALHEIERMGPTVTREQFRKNMGKIWDSIDNRMGELVYDNLFWNRTLKDLSFLAVRAVGWNLGTLRELGGGVLDSATVVKRLREGDPVMTKRMAYLVALPMTVGLMGALYQKLRTGQGPDETRDYFYPKTGQMLPDGTPERVNFPSYLKDIASYKRHPGVTLGHKLHPMWGYVTDMLRNKDFYGTQIRNPDDPLVDQAKQEARFLATTMIPFSVKGAQRRVGAGESPVTKAESFFGIMPISPEIARTPAQNKIMEFGVRKMPVGPRTQSEFARGELRKEIETSLQAPSEAAESVKKLREAYATGKLSRGQAQYIASKLRFEQQAMAHGMSKSESQWLWRYTHLNLEEAQTVYEMASPEERRIFEPVLKRKLRGQR